MVSTLDSESSDPSSNLGGTYSFALTSKIKVKMYFDLLGISMCNRP